MAVAPGGSPDENGHIVHGQRWRAMGLGREVGAQLLPWCQD